MKFSVIAILSMAVFAGCCSIDSGDEVPSCEQQQQYRFTKWIVIKDGHIEKIIDTTDNERAIVEKFVK